MPKVKPPPKDCSNLKHYVKFLHSKTAPFQCPHCANSVLPKDFEKHCTRSHDLTTRLCCAWCFGEKTWLSKFKCENADHLLQCCRNFLILNSASSPSIPVTSTFDRRSLCPEKDFFDRIPDPQPRAYEPVWPMPLPLNLLTFDLDSLNKATSCLRMYLDLETSTEWYHVIVRSVAFQSFLEAMDADEGHTRTLPFSCWCDGGPYEEPRYRQHRHMIAVSSPDGHFERNVWKKIRISPEDRPGPHFRCIHKEPIHSALHLVNTLGYLSQRESICEFSGGPTETPNHYYCSESLPKDFRLVLAMQWEGGLLKLLDQDFRNLKWGELVRADLTFADRKWRFRVQNIPGIPFGLVLPVSPDLVPCNHETPIFLHLIDGHKLYFERLPSTLDSTSFRPLLALPTTSFYEAVGNAIWVPRPFQQRLINEFKPIVDRHMELESENARLQEQVEKERNSSERLKRIHEDSERAWRAKVDALNEKLMASTDKNEALNDKIHQLNEGEIARLKRDLAECRLELNEAKRTKSCCLHLQSRERDL